MCAFEYQYPSALRFGCACESAYRYASVCPSGCGSASLSTYAYAWKYGLASPCQSAFRCVYESTSARAYGSGSRYWFAKASRS